MIQALQLLKCDIAMRIKRAATVLCAIALLSLPSFGVLGTVGIGILGMASPARAVSYAADSSGADSYRKNLFRLRPHQNSGENISKNALTDTNGSSPIGVDTTEIETAQTNAREIDTATDEPAAISPTLANQPSNSPTRIFVGISKRAANLSISLQTIRENFKIPETADRRDPYAVIAAARESTNPLKGRDLLKKRDWLGSIKISSFPQRPSISDISLSETQASIRARAALAKENLTALTISPQTTVKQTAKDAVEAVRGKLIKALSWTEQTAHQAAERVKQP